jgi:histidine decarboxylase
VSHHVAGQIPADMPAERPVQAELDALWMRLERERPTNIGFPGATDFDYRPLAPFLAQLLNNVGDPFVDATAGHTKPMEREVVDFVADLLRAPADDRWGYVTSGASEGNLYALHVARRLHPDAVVYHSAAAHYSVPKAIDLLDLPSIVIRVSDTGHLDYADLTTQLDRHRDRPAIVVATIGTTMTEAIDDVRRINEVLDSLAIHRRFVHADAALAGIPLSLLVPSQRPGFDFADGADSVIVSGHKFVGSPFPCGVVVVRKRHRAELTRTARYTGSPDTTVSGSRSGHAPLVLWYAIRHHGVEGLRARAERSRELAAYTVRRLVDIGWEAYRNDHAFTVVLATPPKAVTDRWVLASSGRRSHIVCMPGVTQGQIDRFVADLEAANAPGPPHSPHPTVGNRRGAILEREKAHAADREKAHVADREKAHVAA